ncbi:MAG: DAK2 domain-containing protein [Lachnospiraceae bacterium]|nr:DAK2 domain-containing protein [Lachnospiraceae bacterium]
MDGTVLNGEDLYSLFTNGYRNLKQNASIVDALNVFPIPDGDTGKNMSMTWLGGIENVDKEEKSAGKMAKAFSKGTLLSARGNSGVILSQFVRGFSQGIKELDVVTPPDFILAMEKASKKAYSAVVVPTEGTMLTVMRECIENSGVQDSEYTDFTPLFEDIINGMKKSLLNTPNILPCLAEAGVVDSGGAGLLYLFEGMNMALQGNFIDESVIDDENIETPDEFFTPDSKRKMKIKKHVKYAIVAAASGEGMIEYFHNEGVLAVIDGGQTNNPSAKAFVDAFGSVDADHIIVLPNDGNIILTAKQAAKIFDPEKVHVIETKSMAEGYSAMSMVDYSLPTVDDLIHEMTHYLPNVTTGYITTATRDANINGVDVKEGAYVGLTDDILSCDTDITEAVLKMFAALPDIDDKQVVTVFYGKGITEEDALAIGDALMEKYPLLEFGYINGKMDVYSYMFAIE